MNLSRISFFIGLLVGLNFGVSAQTAITLMVSLEGDNLPGEAFPYYRGTSAFTGITAFTLQTDYSGYLSYRMKISDRWDNWIPFTKYTEGDITGRLVFEGSPLYIAADSIQFRSTAPVTITARLFYPGIRQPVTVEKEITPNPACNCPQPPYCGRGCWCPSGNCPKDNTPTPTVPTHIVIHHSAGFNSSDNFAAVVAYYWDFHVNTNGWDDIAYNWLIDPNGVIYEGRGSGVQGAHFSCMNSNTTGICLIGDYQVDEPAMQSLIALESLLAWELCDKMISPDDTLFHPSSMLLLPTICGHLDGNPSPAPTSCASATVCPGDRLYFKLQGLRGALAETDCLLNSLDNHSRVVTALFPNPAKEYIQVISEENYPATVKISDPAGRVTHEIQLYAGSRINISTLSAGIYFITLSGRANTTVLKLIVE